MYLRNNTDYQTTGWYAVPSVIVHNKLIDTQNSGIIRKLFTATNDYESYDITKDRSPSLELIAEETGDRTFLDKKLIKHSIRDLSTLSSVAKSKELELPSCHGIQSGPKLYFPICPGDIVVVTISGTMKMTCNEVEKRVSMVQSP